jgi:hypothetical protein
VLFVSTQDCFLYFLDLLLQPSLHPLEEWHGRSLVTAPAANTASRVQGAFALSADNSTIPSPSGKSAKLGKPYPEFSPIALPAGSWCEIIRHEFSVVLHGA